MIIDKRPNLRAIPGQFRWYKSRYPGIKWVQNLGGCPGGCWLLELTDIFLYRAIPFFYPYRGMEGKFPGGVSETFSKGVKD